MTWCDGQAFEREGGCIKRSNGIYRKFVPLDGGFHEEAHSKFGYVEMMWDQFFSWAGSG